MYIVQNKFFFLPNVISSLVVCSFLHINIKFLSQMVQPNGHSMVENQNVAWFLFMLESRRVLPVRKDV